MGLPSVGPYYKHIFQIIRIGHFMDFQPGEPLWFTFLIFRFCKYLIINKL